jgi:hypothetical protein
MFADELIILQKPDMIKVTTQFKQNPPALDRNEDTHAYLFI